MTMRTQDIFKNFGSNWKWASLTVAGAARIHTEQPKLGADGVVFFNTSDFVTSRCEAFDSNVPCAASIWERTDFTNGPSYSTDRFGLAACPPPASPVPMAPAPQAVRITTDEAESGGLWAYARRDENYVSVNTYGVVWFNLFVNGPEPRRSYSVEVTGVTHPIERSRAMPGPVAPPEAGKPFAPAPVAQPVWPTDVDGNAFAPACPDYSESLVSEVMSTEAVPDVHGWADGVAELEKKLNRQRRVYKKAKLRAQHLLIAEHVGGLPQLTAAQYMAIFGELPQ